MTTWDDQAYAARMRDAIRREAIKVVNEERPPYKYGEVVQIDLDINQVKVSYPGDPGPHSVNLLGVVPSHLGQTVQVSGRHGDRFVSGVIGAAAGGGGDGGTAPDMDAPAGFTMTGGIESVSADWEKVSGASRYQVQFASNSTMTTLVREFDTVSNTFTLQNVNPGSTIWGRVRVRVGVGSGSTFGDWTAIQSAQAREWGETGGSDETPPTTSPDAVVTEGLGYLLAEWLPISNQDPVTYEVHASTTSGFTASASTKIGETSGTFFFVRRQANGNVLEYGTRYYIRIWAKDADGYAPVVGAQGSGIPQRVELGDVGNVPGNELTDGVPPATTPVAQVTAGIRSLFLKWDHISNPDMVTYEVFIGTSAGFTVNSNSYVGETPSNFFVVSRVGPGAGGGQLVNGTTYYIKLRSKDNDGFGPAGAASAGVAPVFIQGVDLADLSIDSSKIQANAVTIEKFASGIRPVQVVSSLPSLPSGSYPVGSAVSNTSDGKLYRNHNNVWTAAVPTVDLTGVVVSSQLGPGSVLTDKLADNAVQLAKLADGAVNADKLAANSVIAGKIAANAVTANEIAAATILAGNIAANAITTEKLNANAVTAVKLAANSVIAGKIAANAVTAGTIAADAIVAANIQAGEVNVTHLAANSVTTSKINAGAVTANEIAAGTIIGELIAGNTITGAKILANTITANEIAAGTITAAEINVQNLVTSAAFINNLTVFTANIVDGAITNAKIANLAVNEAKIANLSVSTAKIADAAISTAKIGNLQVTDAKIDTLNVSKLRSGTISAQVIELSNSTSSIIRSSNYVFGSSGWRIRGTGDAELNNATIRHGLFAGTGEITGELLAGGGAVKLNSQGVTITSGTQPWNQMKWANNSNVVDTWLTSGGSFVLTSTKTISIESTGSALNLLAPFVNIASLGSTQTAISGSGELVRLVTSATTNANFMAFIRNNTRHGWIGLGSPSSTSNFGIRNENGNTHIQIGNTGSGQIQLQSPTVVQANFSVQSGYSKNAEILDITSGKTYRWAAVEFDNPGTLGTILRDVEIGDDGILVIDLPDHYCHMGEMPAAFVTPTSKPEGDGQAYAYATGWEECEPELILEGPKGTYNVMLTFVRLDVTDWQHEFVNEDYEVPEHVTDHIATQLERTIGPERSQKRPPRR
jgi:hypothetical protein